MHEVVFNALPLNKANSFPLPEKPLDYFLWHLFGYVTDWTGKIINAMCWSWVSRCPVHNVFTWLSPQNLGIKCGFWLSIFWVPMRHWEIKKYELKDAVKSSCTLPCHSLFISGKIQIIHILFKYKLMGFSLICWCAELSNAYANYSNFFSFLFFY